MIPLDFSYPLKSWTLGGFRAIRDENVFDLGGLNILLGANSAGKSSVLHSLLLTAQTLATPMADRPLVLNGNLVRLGLAMDCVHDESGDVASARKVAIGFGLVPNEVELSRPAMSELTQVDIRSEFSVASDDKGDFELAKSAVTAHLVDEPGKVKLKVEARTRADAQQALRRAGADQAIAEQYADAVGQGISGDIPDRTVGVYARQFLPDSLAVLVNAYLRELFAVIRPWRPRIGVRFGAGVRRRQANISVPVADFICRYVRDLDAEAAAQLPDPVDLTADALSALPASLLEEVGMLPRSAWYNDHVDDLPFMGEVESQTLGGVFDAGVDFARRWFSKSVRHLGPLRAAPQPLYGLPEAASGASVGQNGEYTAAVLSAYGRRVESVPLPDGTIREVQLSTAVDRWMAELGLLAAVRSKERGKLGYEIEVSVEGVQRSLDLTTVGVGVSQALPIVVLGLIAEPNSLLLFEQPELHLHPDVQAALGDFFLALAKSGRQLIIETHSEYLVNRLRRRQVTDEESYAAELVRLFFFERDGPSAKITPARIGQDGSMPDWPRGFLDTAAREVKAMVIPDSS